MPDPTLIALGSINMDFQVTAEHWPESGETMLAGDFLMTAGGKAANVAVLASRLGASVTLIGHVGDDILGEDVLRRLGERGIDLDHVARVPDTATAVSMIVVRPGGEKTITLAPNANLVWDERKDAHAVERVIADASDGSVLVADLEVPTAIVRRAMAAARDCGFAVVLDPSPADRFDDDLAPLVDVLTPNTSEARTITGFRVEDAASAERAARALVDRGVGSACQKLAGGGCVVATEDRTWHVHPPVHDVEVVDQTGAGDAFAGGMGFALLKGLPVEQAARHAVAASSLAVTGFGSQESYPSSEDFTDMLERIEIETIEGDTAG